MLTESEWEEATRCPRCENSGKEVSVNSPGNKITGKPDSRAGKVFTIRCETELCRWFNTTWIVQVRPDGTIPRRTAGEKQFKPMSDSVERIAEAELENLRRLGLA